MHSTINKVLEHKIFRATLYAKAAYGFVEIVLGLFIFLFRDRFLSRIVQYAFAGELLEDPKDMVGNFFVGIAQNLSIHAYTFVGSYFIVHGLVNIGIVAALIAKKRWMFPVVGVILLIFTIYQIILILRAPSLMMTLLVVIDLIILFLLRFEYNRKR